MELGENVQDAAVREVLEETGLTLMIEGLLDVQTDLHWDAKSMVEYHFILVDYLASPTGGMLKLNQESSAAGWFSAPRTKRLKTTDSTRAVLDNYFMHRLR